MPTAPTFYSSNRSKATPESHQFLRHALTIFCCAGFAISAARLAYTFYISPSGFQVTITSYNEMKLPDIAVCPLVPFNTSRMASHGIPSDVIDFVHWHFAQESHQALGYPYPALPRDANLSRITEYIGGTPWEDFVIKYSFSCSELFIQCMNGSDRGADCCLAATPIFNEKRGLCYKFDNAISTGSGIFRGFQALLALPEVEHHHSGLIENGFEVYLDDRIDVPFTTFSVGRRQQTYGAPGMSTNINIIKVEKMATHEQDCSDEDDQCEQCRFGDGVACACNCTVLGYEREQGKDVCNAVDLLRCFLNTSVLTEIPRCVTTSERDCKPSCIEITYPATVSQTKLSPTNIRKELEIGEIMEDHSTTTFALLRVYYTSVVVHEVAQFNLVTFDTVLSQMGGMSGIWLGVSIFSGGRWLMKRFDERSSMVAAQTDVDGKY